MRKSEFIKHCQNNGVPEATARTVWEKLKILRKFIRENWSLCKNLQIISEKEQLKIRRIAAEHGFEWTPDEIKQAILVVGKLQDRMRRK